MPDLISPPIDDIARDAFPRDRTFRRDAAFDDLYRSILRDGLRQPVDVCAVDDTPPYALISGYRRLTAVRRLRDEGFAGFDTIPAFLLRPATVADGVAMMVAENEMRSDISPWDRGRILVEAVRCGYFETIDNAIAHLHPGADRARRMRLRSLAMVVETFEGTLADPHGLSQARLLRLAAACREDFGDLMVDALTDLKSSNAMHQWETLDRVLTEAEVAARDPARLRDDTRPGRPRRRVRVRPALTIRRELAPEGWTLRFTGREATGRLMEEIMDYVEEQFGRE